MGNSLKKQKEALLAANNTKKSKGERLGWNLFKKRHQMLVTLLILHIFINSTQTEKISVKD